MKKDEILRKQARLRIFKVTNLEKIRKLKEKYKSPIDVRIKKIGRKEGLNIYLVDGYKIRQFIDLDFTTGGHGLRYIYVPMDEIWLELPYYKYEPEEIITHEIHEFKLMKKGVDYEKAHGQASLVELEVRNRKIILPVGNHRQIMPWSCGPSALKIVLDYYKDKRDIRYLIKETGCDKTGTLHLGFRKILRKLNYKFFEKQTNSKLKDIENFLKKGIPVIVDYKAYHGGHFSVIMGMDKKRFLFSDPAYDKKVKWMKKKDFEKRWWEEDEPGKIVRRWMLAVFPK